MFEYLTRAEREIYELILRAGELMAKDIPLKKAGVIPSLVRKGLVEVNKRPVSAMGERKLKFLRVKKEPEEKQGEP
ncbi:MAG: hypothetical protein NWF12_05385 [Candidatus Bathyarchaeota archaeon]|nr:hypothetical protein [Candidatus Bathyarchaeota archaeon]